MKNQHRRRTYMSISEDSIIENTIHEILPIPTIHTITKPFMLSEGLLYSYPKQEVLRHLRNTFLLAPNLRAFNRNWKEYNGIALSRTASNCCKVILVYVPKLSKTYNAIIQSMTTLCGWVLANETDISNSIKGFVMLQFEPKTENDVTDMVHKQQTIYHECPNSRLQKVKENGLVSKDSTWDNFSHPDRIYFWLKFPKHKLRRTMQGQKNVYGSNTTVLKVNVQGLNNDVKFYFDHRVPDAVYTTYNIPSNLFS